MDRLPTDPQLPKEFFTLYKATGQPILVAFYAGTPAVAAESLSDAQITEKVMSTLRGMFGGMTPPPRPGS